MTNIMFRPTFSYSTNDAQTNGVSATFQDNPYSYGDDPLASLDSMAEHGVIVNSRQNRSVSYTESKKAGAMLQLNRKLGTKGRNITLRGDMSYADGKSNNLSLSNVHLYQVKDIYGADSTYQTNRYNVTPTKNLQTELQFTYSEPL